MTGYRVKYEKKAIKQLEKIDQPERYILRSWIEKNLVGTTNPRQHGKALKGELNEYWRYRVGDYRIIAEINDDEVLILVIEVGHRRDIYR